MGRAGHARRGRRRILAPAQPAAQARRAAQHAGRRTRARSRTSVAAQAGLLVLMRTTPTLPARRAAHRLWPSSRSLALPGWSPARPGERAVERRTGAIRGRVELRRDRPPRPQRRPARRRPRRAAPHATRRIDGGRSCTSRRRRAGRFEQTEPGRAVMDQRNETFVPHVLAITTGTIVDFPEQRSHLPQRVLALEGRALRSRALRGRAIEVGPLRSAGHRPRVLRHPLAHERVHPRVQPSVLRDDRRGGPLPDRQRAARHLQRDRLERGRCRRSPGRSRSPTAARPSSTSRSDDDSCRRSRSRIFLTSALLAVLSIGAAIYLVNVARHARGRKRAAARDLTRPARSSSSCGRRAPRRSR